MYFRLHVVRFLRASSGLHVRCTACTILAEGQGCSPLWQRHNNLTIQKKRLYGSRNRAALIQLKSTNFIWDTFASNNMMVPYEVGDKVDIVYSFSLRGGNMNTGMNLNIQDIRHSKVS